MSAALRSGRVARSNGGAGSLTVQALTSVEVGDLLLLLGGSDTDTAQNAFVGPASGDGFTSLTPWGGTAGGANIKAWTRRATSADVGKSYVLTVPSGSAQVIYLLAYSGVDVDAPIGAGPVHADGGSATATSLVAPSLTPAAPGLALWAWWTKGGSEAQSLGIPASSLYSGSSTSDTTGYVKAGLTQQDVTTTATGTRTATLAGTARRWSAVSLALRSAPDAQPPRTVALGRGIEQNVALALRRARVRALGLAGERDAARPVNRKAGEVRTAREHDTAAPVRRARLTEIGPAREGDAAPAPLARVRVRRLGVGGERSVVPRVTRRRRRRLSTIALSYDVARQLEAIVPVSDAVYAAALASSDRDAWGTLRVDWAGTGVLPRREGDPGWLDDNVAAIEVERAVSGDLPVGAGEVAGYASASMSAELGGRRRGAEMDLAVELSPFRPDSPHAGRRKTMRQAAVELGVLTEQGPRGERLFTGPVRDIAIDEGAGTVDLDGVDPSERLRALATLPIYGEFVTHVAERARGVPGAGWQFTVNTQWIIDHVLSLNGIHCSPPPRAEAITACSAHGGMVAERGFNGAPISRANAAVRPTSIHTMDDNPWGMLASPEGSQGTYQEFYGFTDQVNPPVRFQAGHGAGVSGWVHLSGRHGGSADDERILWQLWPTHTREPRLFVHLFADGTVAAGLFDQNAFKIMSGRVRLTDAKWNFIGVHFRWVDNDTLGIVFRVRGWDAANGRPAPTGQTFTTTLAQARVTVTPTPFYDGYRAIVQTRAYCWRAWMLLQTWVGATPPPAGPWQGEDHVSMADVGRGNNELTHLPDIAAEDSWPILRAAVDAEYGAHGFDEWGRYYFRARRDTRAPRIDHYLDVETTLAEVRYQLSADTIRNSIGVTTKPAYHTGALETVVRSDSPDQFIVPGNSTRVWELDWPHGAAGWQGGTLPYHYQKEAETAARDRQNGFPEWSSDVVHGWTYASRGASGGWTIYDNTRSVVVSYVQNDIRKVKVRIRNGGSGEIRISTTTTPDRPDGGEPAMRIGGWPLNAATDRVTTYRNAESIAELGGTQGGGERSLPIASSQWRQHEPALRPVAEALLVALADETPILEDLPVKGNPTIRVGNVVSAQFRDLDVPVIGTVVRTRHRLSVSDGRLSTHLALRPLPVARQPLPEHIETLAPPGWLFYIDISHHQRGGSNPLDLDRAADAGYAGCVARIGQGAGEYTTSSGTKVTHGQVLDTAWTEFRDRGLQLWPRTFAAYWYVGNVESPTSQAQRCAGAIGDMGIPVMLDWEDGSGSWSNLLACRDAFVAAGLTVTMLYTNMQNYARNNGAADIDATGLALVNSRYWIARSTNPAQDPRAVWDDVLATRPDFGFEGGFGGTVDALQFTDAGIPYPGGPGIDVNAFPGDIGALSTMMHGE